MTTNEFFPIANGTEMRILRQHEGRGMTFLIRMQPGAVAPRHDHPGGEETYLLEGCLRIAHRRSADGVAQPDIVISTGEYAFAPPGETHDGIAEGPTLFLVVAPGGVRVPQT